MSDKLRSYIKNNKEKFDSAEPSGELWKKIDSELKVKGSKNKWTSNLKYFGFGAGIIVVTVYFVSQQLNDPSSNALAQHTKDSALNSSGVWVKTNQDGQEVNANENSAANSPNSKIGSKNFSGNNSKEEGSALGGNSEENNKKDTLIVNTSEYPATEQKVKQEEEIIPAVKEEKPVPNISNRNRKKAISVPEAPSELNVYNAALYDGSSLCEVIQAYKFPGKVSMDDEANFQGHRILKTIPCSKLENMGNVKAVWLKGKTGKKLSLSITEGLKNIVLAKKDGRKIFPIAISHYYKGLGVISDYTGKHFELNFKENVELILFFKDAEDGDKVIIDGKIEASVSTK